MILNIFTIHDKKAEAYLPPFYLPQTGMALRTFADCINDNQHSFSKHPEDYTLMSIGTFDDTTAEAIAHSPQSLGNGLNFYQNEVAPEQGDLLDPEPMEVKAEDLPKKVRVLKTNSEAIK